MSYFDSLSLFSEHFEQRVADPAELGRQLFAHRMEADYVKAAIVELGTVAQFKQRARKLTPAAKTLAGETAISWLFGVGGRASWGELSLTVRRAHKMAGNRNDRVLQQLEDAGVIVCTYHGRDADRLVTVALSYELWLPAEITCASCGSSGTAGKCASWCPQTPRELVAEKSSLQLADERREREVAAGTVHPEMLPPATTEEVISGVIRRGDGGSAIRRAIEHERTKTARRRWHGTLNQIPLSIAYEFELEWIIENDPAAGFRGSPARVAAARSELARRRQRRDDDDRRAAEGDEQRDYAEERFNEQLMREE